MKRTKLITAVCVLAVVLLLGLFTLPTTAQAATSGDYTYEVSNGKATITGYTGPATDLTIPSVLGGYPVTAIGDHAFQDYRITGVTIPDSVTSIGDSAFYNCNSLTSVTIGNSVTSIGSYAFYWCYSLTGVTIPDSVTSISDYAFFECSSLTNVTIPDSVTSIGHCAFFICTNLTGIWVDEDNPNYSSDSYGVLFNKDKNILYQAPGGISGSYTIPDSVTSIDSAAFFDCYDLTSVTIPDSVTSISSYAFYCCYRLTSVTIGNRIISIGDSAFDYCDSLSTVYYAGSQSQWNAISIDSYNDCLTNATIHYNYAPCTHDYTANPTTCGNCGYVRADVSITNVVLRPTCSGLYFKGSFTYAADVEAVRYGIAVSVYSKLPMADDSDDTSLYTIGNNSVLISNILDSSDGKTLIYARAYVLLADGTYIYGDVVATNLQSVAETIDTKWSSLAVQQQKALQNMFAAYSAVTSAWNLPNYQVVAALCPCGCGANANEVVWQDANAYISGNSKPVNVFNADGHYRLSGDLDITAVFGTAKQINVGKSTACKVVIDLNGYTWSSNHRLYIYENSELCIMDSSTAGTGKMISTGKDGVSGRVIANYGTFNLYSGTLTMDENTTAAVTSGGVVYNSMGVFNMYGGRIIGGRVDGDSGVGGNVTVHRGEFNMYGGEISGGTAAQGANIYIGQNGTFNISGGTVQDMENTVCQWQKQVLPVDPANVQNRAYEHYSVCSDTCLMRCTLDFALQEIVTVELIDNEVYQHPGECTEELVEYKGKFYHGTMGDGGTFICEIVGNYLQISNPGGYGSDAVLTLEVLSDDTLRVVSISGDDWFFTGISVGDIFS